MKRALSQCTGLALILAASLSMTACSKTPAQTPPQGQAQTQEGPVWKVIYQSTCGADGSASPTSEEAAGCVARHGFSVIANKTWQAGPTPQGQVKGGAISEEDFAKVDAALNELASHTQLNNLSAGCGSDAANAESDASGTKLIIEYHGVQTSLCTAANASATPAHLIAAMEEIAKRYYPVPFPDACADAADAVHALYANLQSCNTDTDCAYINSGYEVVSRSVAEYVLTDDCTMVRPLVVGNAASVQASQGKLLSSLNQAQMACGARLIRTSCGALEGFDSSTAAAPICRENVCRVQSGR